MSQTNTEKIIDPKKIESFNAIYQVWKADVNHTINKDTFALLQELTTQAWEIAKDKNIEVEKRKQAYELIQKLHEMLNRKFDVNWIPKGDGKSRGQTFIATKEQRAENCNNFAQYLKSAKIWEFLKPEEPAQVLAIVWGSLRQ